MLYWLDQSEQIKLTFNSKDYSLIKNMITLANTVTSTSNTVQIAGITVVDSNSHRLLENNEKNQEEEEKRTKNQVGSQPEGDRRGSAGR